MAGGRTPPGFEGGKETEACCFVVGVHHQGSRYILYIGIIYVNVYVEIYDIYIYVYVAYKDALMNL